MGQYPDRYPRNSFTSHINVTHEPTGFKFYQQAGRIMVLQLNEASGFYQVFTDFTTWDLQIEGTVLTETALIRAAIVWLKDNHK